MQLLDPFQIDDRNHADLEIDMLGDIDGFRHDRAVQALVKEQVRAPLEVAPGRERSGRGAMYLGLVRVMNVTAGAANAGLRIIAERLLEFME
jgi:hypothetical protein